MGRRIISWWSHIPHDLPPPNQHGQNRARKVRNMKTTSEIGDKFGRLTLLRRFKDESVKRFFWECACGCGVKTIVRVDMLKNGNTKSCGCLQKDMQREACLERNSTHGMYGSSTYVSWIEMHTRCYNKKRNSYRHYGGRGIKMCLEWKASFLSFLRDMGERPSKGHSIDRIDVNGDYEPSNCRWASRTQQARNTRKTRITEAIADGMRELKAAGATLAQISEFYTTPKNIIGHVLSGRGWLKEAA